MNKAVLSPLVATALLMFAGAAMAQGGGVSGYTEQRLNQLQQSTTELARRIEQLQRQEQQLQQQLERMQSSYEHRLDQLEKGNAGKAPSARKRQPRSKRQKSR